MSKLTVQVDAFRPLRANTLYGFCNATIAEMHLRILDLTVHQKDGKRWIGLPAKPQITRDGQVRKDEHGKALYMPGIEFTDRQTRDAFSARVIASLLEFAPAAFEFLTLRLIDEEAWKTYLRNLQAEWAPVIRAKREQWRQRKALARERAKEARKRARERRREVADTRNPPT
jgi:hypothetical protein